MRNGWGLLALSLLLVSCGRDFSLPGGELALTDLTVEPARLAAGETLTISFGVQGELTAPPRVSLLGQLLTPPEAEGGRYTLRYTALGTEPEAVDVVVEVSVSDEAEQDSRFAVFRFDFTPPEILRTTVSAERVVSGETLSIDMVLSEALASTPSVTLVDARATDPVLDCNLAGLLLRCSHSADGSETEGWITLSTRLEDLAGNEAILSHPVGAAFDASSAPLLQLGTVAPSPASRGMSVLLPISSSLPLDGDPLVTVAGQPASRVSGPDTSGRWVFAYFVTGTELGAQPTTGVAPLRVEATSLGGIANSLDAAVPLDFEAPQVVAIASNPSVADAGETVSLSLFFDEPTAAVSALIQAVPFGCTAVTPTQYDCSFTATGNEVPGPVLVVVVAADFLGNSATRSIEGDFDLDFECEADREKIFVVSNHLGERRFVAEVGAFEAGASVRVSNAPGGTSLLDTVAGPDGSVASIDLGSSLRIRAYVAAVDPQGHACPTLRSRSRFIADFQSALAPNPDHARMLVVGTARPDPLSLEPEPTLSDHQLLVAADGQRAEVQTPATSTAAWIDRGPPAGCPCSPSATPMFWHPRLRQAAQWYRASGGEQGVWGWDGSGWTWISRLPPGADPADTVPPVQERSFGLAFDPIREEALLFGGAPRLGDPTEDRLSIFDGYVWHHDESWPRPEARMAPVFTFDRGRGVSLLFGGSNFLDWPTDPWSEELWAWDGERWQPLDPLVKPPPRIRATFSYDSVRDQVLLFGGYGEGSYLDDTWAWTGTNWIQHQPSGSPSPRGYTQSVFHGGLGGIVLHGGEGASGTSLDDLWLFDGLDWQEISPPQPRPALSYHGMTYDPIRGRLVAYGGYDAAGLSNRNVWELPSDAFYPVFLGTFHLPAEAELTSTGTLRLLAEGHGTLRDGSVVNEVDVSAWDASIGRWILVDRIPSGVPSQVALTSAELARFGDGALRVLLAPASPSSPAGDARLAVDHLLLEIDDG